MLAIKDIAYFIQHPNLSDSKNVEQLKEYTKKFPYSSLFSILYLKSLSNSSSIQFEEELTNHSYRIPDRRQLYNLIHQHTELAENISPTIEKEEQRIILPISEDENKENEIILPQTVETVEMEQNKIETDSSEEKEEEKEEIVIQKQNDVVEESILQHAFSANYQLPELNDEEIIELNKKNSSQKKETEITQEKPRIELTVDTKQSFKSWLSADTNYTKKENEEKPSIVAIKEHTEKVKTKEELLEASKKPKKAFFSPTEKGKESLNEDVLPVSETLAKIYALQGNFPKAISAYIQLSLINPEKKIFFALRIKELEQKLKHK